MLTPLGLAAKYFELGPRALRWSTTAALFVSIIIVFTGGLVRVTGSGLGCPDWPTCHGASITSTPELGIHGAIEFANRVLTSIIVVMVGWVIVAARLQRPRVRAVTRLAWSQFWLVIANAVAGGITVLVGLNPWVVALHFVLAMGLLATTTLSWHRVHEHPLAEPQVALGGRERALSWVLVGATAVLIAVGTLASGAGPHSGDSREVPRMALDWTVVTVVHGVLATLVFALAIVLLFSLRGSGRAARVRLRTIVFIVVLIAQGGIGLIQSLTGLPEALVSFHLLGAALIWVGVLRVLLDANSTLFAGVVTKEQSAKVVSA